MVTADERGRLGHVPALDGLRALAILLVVAYHATGYPAGGWLGVDLFFVLSGFLITTLLVERQGRESIGTFYQRRAVRLLPALLALLLVSLAIDRSLFGALAGLGYFSNIVMASGDLALIPLPLQHLWSLAVEEQFYILWPLVLYFALRFSMRLALGLACGAVMASFLLSVYFTTSGVGGYRLVFAPDTRGVSLLVGCVLALGMTIRPLSLRRLEIPALALIFGLAVTMGIGVSGPPILLFALASAVIVVRARQDQSLVSRVLSLGAVVFVGRISYSLYLWHYPILVWLGVEGAGLAPLDAVALGLAAAVACASYYVIEKPATRRLRPVPERRRTRQQDAQPVVARRTALPAGKPGAAMGAAT